MRYNKVAAARALGVGRNTILAYEKSALIPTHIELACAALACSIKSWGAVRDGNLIVMKQKDIEDYREQLESNSIDDEDARRIALRRNR